MSNKSKIFISFFWLLCHSAFMQNGFNNYYLSGIQSTAIKITPLDQTKFILTSYYKDSSSSQQGLDLKHIDYQGNLLLRRRYMFLGMDFGNMLYNTDIQNDISNSTTLLTAGTSSNSVSTVIYLSINKNTLDTNWVRYFNDGINNYFLNSVIKTKPNEFWLFGHRWNPNLNNRPVAIKLDSSGLVLSVKEYTSLINYFPQSSYYDTIQNLIYMTGKNTTNPNSFKTFAACMDTLGNVLWNIDFANNPYRPIYSQIVKRNNYLILCGMQGESLFGGFEDRRLTIVKLHASNGSIIWNKRYFPRFYTNYLSTVVINEDESIVATGSAGLNTGILDYNNDGAILKVNNAGDSLWMQTFSSHGQGIFEGFYHIAKAPDGGYITCGYITDPANNQSWVVKTDSLGVAPGLSTSLFDYNLDQILKIYPQPARNELNITFEKKIAYEYNSVEIFDALGKLIKEEQIKLIDQKVIVPTYDLPGGAYYLRFSGKAIKSINRRFIVVK